MEFGIRPKGFVPNSGRRTVSLGPFVRSAGEVAHCARFGIPRVAIARPRDYHSSPPVIDELNNIPLHRGRLIDTPR